MNMALGIDGWGINPTCSEKPIHNHVYTVYTSTDIIVKESMIQENMICGNFTYFEKRCRMMDVVMRKSNGTLTDPSFSINDTFYPPVISDWQWKIP